MRRPIALTVLGTAVLLAAAAVLVHAPFVRQAVLRYAIGRLQQEYGIRVDADRLDYNLATRRFGLAGVRVSAAGQQPPFFEAGYVAVTVPRQALVGDVSFDEVAVTDGMVRLRRSAIGVSNIPASGDGGGEPAPLRIGRLSLSALRVDVRDEQYGVVLDVPAADIALGAGEGRIVLRGASLQVGDRRTRIASLAGGARFDGRTLQLADVAVQADEANARVNGGLTLITREPRLDLRVAGSGEAARLARWGMAEAGAPRGAVTFDGRVHGPFGSPTIDAAAASPRLTIGDSVLTNVAARAHLTPDLLTVESLDADVRAGHLSGSFRLPLEGPSDALTRLTGEARVQLTDGATSLTPLPLPGESRIVVGARAWRLDGRHRVGGVAPAVVSLHGRLADDLLRSTISGRVQVADSDVPALLDALRHAAVADAPADVVAAGRARGEARVEGTLGRMRVAFSAASDELRVATPAVHGPATVAGTFDTATGRYAFEGGLTGWQLQPESQMSGSLDATFRGLGRGAVVSAGADLVARQLVVRGREVGGVSARVELQGGVAHVVAQVPRFASSLDGTVATAAPHLATVDITASGLDLAVLLGERATPLRLSGTTTVSVRATGPLDDWRRGSARVELQELQARAGDLPLRLVEPAVVRYENERGAVDRFEAAAGDTRISASGDIAAFQPPTSASRLGSSPGNLIVTATGDVGEVARAIAATGLTNLPVIGGSGPVAVLARVTGSLEAPDVAADVEIGPGSIVLADLPPVRDVRLRAHVADGWVDLPQAEATYQGTELAGAGRVPLRFLGIDTPGAAPGSASLRMQMAGATARVLQPWLDAATVGDIDGSLDATLNVEAPSMELDEMRGEMQIDRLDLRVADLPVAQRVPTRIVARDGFARIEAWSWSGQGADLDLAGQVRLRDGQAAILASGDLDLGMLTPFVRNAGLAAAGSLQPRLSITGNLADPRIDGDLRVSAAEIRLAEPRVVVSDLSGRIVLTRSTAAMTAMSGSINGGSLSASGTAGYRATGASARVGADIRGMALEFPDGLRSELDADLQLDLDGSEGRLTGDITVLRASYREPLAVLTGLLATLRVARVATAAPEPTVLDHLALDVHVVTDEDIAVDNNYGRFQLGADLRVISTAAAPALSGRAALREGGQLFVGRNIYTIEAGTIDFTNPAFIEPNFNIELQTRVGREEILVTLAGTPDTLDPSLQSGPSADEPLSEADLASLLVTGRRLDELASTDAMVLSGQLLGNLSADVLGFAGRAVGLDTLRVGAGPVTSNPGDSSELTTQLDPTSRLTFGKAIGDDVDVTFSQSLRDGGAQTWIVDYLPSRQIDLRLVSDDDDLRTYGFRHDLSFGGPRRARAAEASRRRAAEPRITAVVIAGETGILEARVREVLSLDVGDRFDFVEWQDDRDRITALYQRQGYLTARVSAARAATVLTYAIAPGPRTALVVRGATLPPSVVNEIRRTWADSFFDGFLEDEAADIARRALAQEGYPNAEVTAQLTDADGTRTLTIDATPGPRGTPPLAAAPEPPPAIGQVTFEGASLLPIDRLRDASGLAQGMPADVAAIDSARQRLVALYRGEGFATATVVPRPAPRDGARIVDVAFVVREGPRQLLSEVVVEGNRAIDRDVVERALRLPRGEPLRPAEWLQARSRVFATGLFRRVDVLAEPMGEGAAGATVPMRMRVVVEEWPALRARYGFQVGEERPEDSVKGRDLVPGLSADVSRRTLFGRAVTLGGAVELQRRERLGRAFVNAPTMLGLPVRSSFIVERSRRDVAADTFVTDVTSVAFEQRLRMSPRLSVSYTYRFERNHTYDTEPAPNDPLPFDIQIDLARINGSVAWDSRDDFSDTTRGLLLSSSVEYAPAAVGSDFRYLRSLSQAYYFKPWRRVVFASAARAGIVRALGGQDVIPSLRFFAGGARTVRGVEENGLGERDFLGDPAGGESLLVVNQEVRFPIYRWLRGVAFVDAGSVFSTASFGIRDLTPSAGVGLRLTTPFGVVRADAGRVLSSGRRQSGGVSVGIGQTF